MSPPTPGSHLAWVQGEDRLRYGIVSARLGAARLLPLDAPEAQAARPAAAWDEALTHPERFLGLYSLGMVADALRGFGMLEALARSAAGALSLTLEATPIHCQRLQVHDASGARLLEMIVRREHLVVELPYPVAGPQVFTALGVERLRLERPGAPPELPGQAAAGAGLARSTLTLLMRWAVQVGAAAVLAIPEFLHTAVVFTRGFAYLDPAMAGFLRATRRDLLRAPPGPGSELPCARATLAAVSWAFERGAIHDADTHQVLLWPTELQLIARAPALRRALTHPARDPLIARACRRRLTRVDPA